MADAIKVGDIVDVTIQGVRIAGDQGPRGTVSIVADDGTHYVMPPQAALMRVAPAEWPPRRGDVWRQTGSGLRWFGIVSGSSVYLHSDQGDVLDPQGAYEERAELELAYRGDEPSDEVLAAQVARVREVVGELHEQAPCAADPTVCRENCPGCAANAALDVEDGNPAGQVEAVRDAATELHVEFFSPAAYGHEQGGGCRDNCPGCRIEAALDAENGDDRG